jgi:hypothetical protein
VVPRRGVELHFEEKEVLASVRGRSPFRNYGDVFDEQGAFPPHEEGNSCSPQFIHTFIERLHSGILRSNSEQLDQVPAEDCLLFGIL